MGFRAEGVLGGGDLRGGGGGFLGGRAGGRKGSLVKVFFFLAIRVYRRRRSGTGVTYYFQ